MVLPGLSSRSSTVMVDASRATSTVTSPVYAFTRASGRSRRQVDDDGLAGAAPPFVLGGAGRIFVRVLEAKNNEGRPAVWTAEAEPAEDATPAVGEGAERHADMDKD